VGWRGLGSVREKSLAGGGGHNVSDISGAVFLVGGDVEVHTIPLLLQCPGENPKSLDWAAAAPWRHILLKASSWACGKGSCFVWVACSGACRVFGGGLGLKLASCRTVGGGGGVEKVARV
jgi:hypothetical protein